MRHIQIGFLLLYSLCLVQTLDYRKFLINFVTKVVANVINGAEKESKCGQDILLLLEEFKNKNIYPLQMLDASGKINPGILSGNVIHFGNYEQCLQFKSNISSNIIRGQYCTILISPGDSTKNEIENVLNTILASNTEDLKMATKWREMLRNNMYAPHAICIPASCNMDDLKMYQEYIESFIVSEFHVEFYDFLCHFEGKETLRENKSGRCILVLFALVAMVLLSCTIYEVLFYHKEENELSRCIVAISLYSNTKKLFSSKPKEDSISCIGGIRVINMFWIILGHRYAANAFWANVNGLYVFQWWKKVSTIFILGAFMGPDSFLFISGLLVTYVSLDYGKIKGFEFSVAGFYAARIIRIMPMLIVFILINYGLLKYMADGPIWLIFTQLAEELCAKAWWAHVLFINNEHPAIQCVPQSWYLSVDTQLYWTFPAFYFMLKRNPRKALKRILLLIAASMLFTVYITVTNNYGSTIVDASAEFWRDIYMSTSVRASAWLIGLATGYFLHVHKNKGTKINKQLNIFLWGLSIMSLILVILSFLTIHSEGNLLRAALFNSLLRPLWSLSLSWIVFSCALGCGSIINNFLSWKIFTVLARLTYSMFYVHMLIILVMTGRRQTYEHFSDIKTIHDYFGDLVLTIVLSIPFTLAFESPSIQLGKIFLEIYVTGKFRKYILKKKLEIMSGKNEVYDKNEKYHNE